jgi:soluble lytic murein transglycosylase
LLKFRHHPGNNRVPTASEPDSGSSILPTKPSTALQASLSSRRSVSRVLTAGALAVACLSCGCAGKDQSGGSPLNLLKVRAGSPMPFQQTLENIGRLSPEELQAQLSATISAAGTSEETRREAAYVLARSLQKAPANPDPEAALSLYAEAEQVSALKERCLLHSAECATMLGQEKVVRKALSDILALTQSDESRASAEYGLAQSFLRGNEKVRAREAFSELRQKFPRSNYALGSAFYLAEMHAAEPTEHDQALALYREYLKASPDGHFARNILVELAALKDYTPTAADRVLFGQVHFVHGEWQAALEEWTKSQTPAHWYDRAVCLLKLNRTDDAKQALRAGISAHSSENSLPAAARTLCQLLSHDEAVAVWKTILAQSKRYADLALWNLAIRCDPPQSVEYYRELLTKYPQSDYAPEASWWTFWDQVQHGKLGAALAQAEAAESRYAKTRPAPRFAYWIGKLNERLSRREAAVAAYKKAASSYAATYYGWRAHHRLQALRGGKDSGWATAPARKHPESRWTWPKPPELVTYEQLEQKVGPTVTILIKLHQWEEALELLPPGANATARSFLLAMENLPLDAINAAGVQLAGKPERAGRWQLAYPLLYAETVAQEAGKVSLDPLLVHALIREESRYNPLALSSSNALGLMQLLPGTAYGIAKRVGINLASNADIYKPENNLALGINYLSYVVKRNQSSGPNAAMLGVASYNGGPNAVSAWVSRMRRQGATDWDTFVEGIPFKETRDYVRKVFGSYWNYQAIYQSNASKR